MSCFCIASLPALPSLNLDASLSISVSAQASLDLYAQISAGLPDLPWPDLRLPGLRLPGLRLPELPSLDISAGVMATLAATAQLKAMAQASLGIDLTTSFGITSIARLVATLDARMSAIAALNLNFAGWIQLAQINSVSLELSAVFQACLNVDARASAVFNMVVPPLSWNVPSLPHISALLALSADLDVELIASLAATASAVAQATANITMDLSAVASLAAGVSAIARLSASLGVNPLQVGLPRIRVLVAANFSAMVSLAAELGIDFSLGLPALPAIPGFSAALTASLTAQLHAAIGASASLEAMASVDLSFWTS